MSNDTTTTRKKRYLTLRSYLTVEEQNAVQEEVLSCHAHHSSHSSSFESLASSTHSLKLALNVGCGASLKDRLPLAVQLCRRAFGQVQDILQEASLAPLCVDDRNTEPPPLSGLALLYGPNGKMPAHYDSPTQHGQRHEWLAMLTIGNAIDFSCNDEIITLQSGDALVMDSMAVLHGVKGIVADDGDASSVTPQTNPLPVLGSRLGILMWEAAATSYNTHDNTPSRATCDDEEQYLDGAVSSLFPDSSSSDDEA
jgi:hypothetical protein